MEAALLQAGTQPPPLVVIPPGYWVEGTDHNHALDSSGRALLPAHPAWQPTIDQDDTAKYYRRFYVGRVRNRLHHRFNIHRLRINRLQSSVNTKT